MSDLLRIGSSGVSAYRNALSVVGDNVANAETDGYARRTVSLTESVTSYGINPGYIERSRAGGVDFKSVNRAWDDFKAAESRIGSSDAGRADARMRWLVNAETALADGDTGPGAKLTAFFNSADALAADPTSEIPRARMLSSLAEATNAIRTTASSLTRATSDIATEGRQTVDALNADLAALARINISLARAAPGTPVQAAAFDERDRLIDNIASSIGIDVSLSETGAATVTLAGDATAVLVKGNLAAGVDLTQAADGRLSLSKYFEGATTAVLPNGGTLSGLIDVAATVTGRRQSLDAIATDFATALNAWSAGGIDANGNAGADLVSITGGSAATLRAIVTDPDLVAAASTTGVANGNLIALQPLRDNGAEQRLANLVAAHAQTVSSAKSEAAAASTRRDNLFAERDATSGVDLDREAAELIRFQQAYNASSRIIQVARETMQSILDLF